MIKLHRFHYRITLLLTAIICLSCQPAVATRFSTNSTYSVCFTPGGDCTQSIFQEINHARQSVYVQAYSFTSAPIAKALADAQKRGVSVNIILDKSQIKSNQYSSATYFKHQGIPLFIDYKPAIAHNKIIIIDNKTVITGSFNFTKAAQERNAENVLIIHDAALAEIYLNNWNSRKGMSIKVGANI